jgi:hypothetical protein
MDGLHGDRDRRGSGGTTKLLSSLVGPSGHVLALEPNPRTRSEGFCVQLDIFETYVFSTLQLATMMDTPFYGLNLLAAVGPAWWVGEIGVMKSSK